jgi:hypothetical protein
MLRLALVALIAFTLAAPAIAAGSNRSRATVKVHAPKKRGPKFMEGNYNPNKGKASLHRVKK